VVLSILAAFSFTAAAQQGGRGSVSKTPEALSNKAKIAVVTQYTQARKADGTAIAPITVDGVLKCQITTESGQIREIGVVRSGKCQVQPLVVTYVDENLTTRADDTFGAVSLDDGTTWRKTNLSHSAEKLVDIKGLTYGYGDTAKPVLSVAGRNLMVAWTSKHCPMGNPSGFPDATITPEDPDEKILSYPSDHHKVAGQQGVVNYGEVYERPDLGTKPFSCVYAARGTVDAFGNIIWSKDEQLTSGRRDAYQLTSAVAGEAGFAMAWQEDPVGLNPGKAAGPGEGMSGATVNHKTDIWYSFVTWGNFLKGLPTYTAFQPIEPSTPPEDPPTGGRPAVTVRMSSPVRITDNAACRVTFDEFGAKIFHGAPICKVIYQNGGSISAPNEDGKQFVVTRAGVPLDGNTGASRVNLFLQKVTYTDIYTGTTNTTAEAIIGYEETKGMGSGDEKTVDEDLGKNVVYHHMPDFANTESEIIQPGLVLNHPELDSKGNPMVAADGKTLLYKNARRIRFIIQPKAQKGASGTVMAIVWKEGAEGKGRPSDIMMRLAVNGYAETNIVCDSTARLSFPPYSVCVSGARNVSASQPQEIFYDTSGGTPKVITWKWDEKNLYDDTEANPYEDARAHRGILKGDFLAIGYTWTPNWAATRNGNDVYDYFIRRSFNGGRNLSNMQGQFEDPRNVSKLRGTHSNSITAIEPRIVGTPSTILAGGNPTGITDDTQNAMVFFTSYGTASNPDLNLGSSDDDEEIESVHPLDIFWSFSDNRGESYHLVERFAQGTSTWVTGFNELAGDNEVYEGEAQLRVNPAGTKLSAVWLGESSVDYNSDGVLHGPCIPGSAPGSDICHRGIDALNPLARYTSKGDGILTLTDFAMMKALADSGGYDAKFDFNEDGEINMPEDGRLWIDACQVFNSQNPAAKIVCPVVKFK
jgi:hypothetical protein